MSAGSMSVAANAAAAQAFDTNSVGPVSRAGGALSPEDVELLEKWNTLGLTHHPVAIEDVRFMMSSKLAFSIALFKNSTGQGQARHALCMVDGAVCMKKEGGWVPLSVVRANLEYDPTQDKIVTKGHPEAVWSYLSPNGLVQFDRYKYDALPVVEELSCAEHAAILNDAQSFWCEGQPEVDAGVEKKCVLQIVTTNRVHSDGWATENLMRGWPEHVTFRAVASDGKVYSFGFQMEKQEENTIFKDKSFPYPLTFLKTTETRITALDYEEGRPYRLKRVTGIPITQARMDAILAFIAEKNKKGVTFNFIRQNCATLASELIGRAGITNKPARWTLGHGLASLLPEWNKIPYVGAPLAFVMNVVNYVSQKIFDTFEKYVPKPIRNVVTFIPRKISAFIANVFLVTLGGRLASQSHQAKIDEGSDVDTLNNRAGFTCFSRLIRRFGDMFREDLSDLDAHQCLIDWQIRQGSTQVHRSDGVVKFVF